MTTTAELEQRMKTALRLIRVMWPAMLATLTPSGGSVSSLPTPRALYTLEDDDDSGHDLPRTEVVLSLRLDTEATLAYWARQVVARRKLTETIPTRDARELCSFLDRHARWVTGQPDVARCVDDLEHYARQCRNLTFPRIKDELRIGDCPNTIGVEGVPVECRTSIVVRSSNPGNIKCSGCGLIDTLDGWVLRIVGTEGPFTASQLIPILHRRLGIVVTETAIRKWVSRGVIEPVKDGFAIRTDERGAYLYDARDVMTRIVAAREKRVPR